MTRSNCARLLLVAATAIVLTTSAATAEGPFQFFSLTPCRLADTRGNGFTGLSGPPALAVGVVRSFPIRGLCGVPSTAKAAALNVTIASPTANGHLVIWPYGGMQPNVSTINWIANEPALANGAIVPLSTDPTLHVSVAPASNVHLILDVTGFFQ